MRKHKLILTVISLLVLSGIFVTALAVQGGKKPDISAGKTENLIADRIYFSLENTEFTIRKTSDIPEDYTLTMFLEARKTQGDFYGVINSLTLSGIAYDNMAFTDLTGNAESKTLDSLILTATNGEPDTYRWQIDLNLSFGGKGTYKANVRLSYTSGTSEDSAMEKFVDIPVTITVE